MGSTNITYEQPEYEPDTSFKDFLQYEKERAATLDQRAAEEKAARDAAEELRRQTGASGLTDFYDRTAKQLQQGLIGFEGAQLNLQNYMDKYQLGKGFLPQTTTTYTGKADDPDTEEDESKTTTTTEAFIPNYTDPTKGASQYLDKLQDLYSGEGGILGQQREAGVQLAYQDILGREASPDELSGALRNLGLQAYGSSAFPV